MFPQVGYPRVGGTPGTHGGVPRVLTARVVCLFAQVGIVAVNLVGDSADDEPNPTNPTKADDPVVPRPSEELLAVRTREVPGEYP